MLAYTEPPSCPEEKSFSRANKYKAQNTEITKTKVFICLGSLQAITLGTSGYLSPRTLDTSDIQTLELWDTRETGFGLLHSPSEVVSCAQKLV